MANISIIIPFYQNREGILRKALESIQIQKSILDYQIIVVDDGSPVQSEKDIKVLDGVFQKKIKIIKQQNGGPASARNKGLDSISKNTDYVAFLDSDDVWESDHLMNAVSVLERGYDFFFTDFFHLGQNISAFNRAGRISPETHNPIDENGNFEFIGNFSDQIITGNVVGTSTVVYRFNKFTNLRFREDLVMAGEDYLFWLGIASQTEKIAFSSKVKCFYGKGVNIYSGSGWGTEKSIDLLYYEIKYRKIMNKEFVTTEKQRQHINKNLHRLQEAVISDVFHRMFNKKNIKIQVLKDIIYIHPIFVFWIFPLTFKHFLKIFQDRIFKKP